MHSLARRFIKTGVGFLGVGLGLGLWLLVRRDLFGLRPHPQLVSAHAHVVLVGFVVFLILGVALWMFPRPARGDTRYRPVLAGVAYWFLLTGTLARFVAEAALAWTADPALGWLSVGAAICQVAGIAIYFWTMWTRIRPSGSRLREAEGERF